MRSVSTTKIATFIVTIVVATILVTINGKPSMTASARALPEPIDEGGGGIDYGPSDALSESESSALLERAYANIERLRAEGKLPDRSKFAADPTMDWPMTNASGIRDYRIGLVVNFVDHNPAFPNQILDWNCGTRTYDLNDGSNHAGTDIVTQVFPWKNKNDNNVNAVAAAGGIIVTKTDGYPDSNCSITGSQPVNEIQILHRDGTIGRYLHFKSGSLTSKDVGDIVSAGEYLGVPGSSGRSTVPHLHFELRDTSGHLQDPYQGACNTLNLESRWTDQEPYRNSQILNMTTGSAAPVFQACPQEEISNEKIVFQPGDDLVTTAFYRDQQAGQLTAYSIRQPDGSIFASWQIISPDTYNIMRYWFRTWQLPTDAPTGRWTYSAKYDGKAYERFFYVGQPPNVSLSGYVRNNNGTALNNAVIRLTEQGSGEVRIFRTPPFGYFRFDEIEVGKTYIVDVSAKGWSFNRRTFLISDDIEDLELRAK